MSPAIVGFLVGLPVGAVLTLIGVFLYSLWIARWLMRYPE